MSWHRNSFRIIGSCKGNPLVTGGFPRLGSVMESFNIFFVVNLNKLSNKQSSCWWFEMPWHSCDIINTLRPRQNGRHFADDTLKTIFLNENIRILIKISLKFVPDVPINNIPALVQIMAWHRPGDKPLSEPMMVCLLTHICVTMPQWVNESVRLNKPHYNIIISIELQGYHIYMLVMNWSICFIRDIISCLCVVVWNSLFFWSYHKTMSSP